LWQSETTEGFELANAVAVGAGRVATVGRRFSRAATCSHGNSNAYLRVFDATTGAPQWTAEFDLSCLRDEDVAVAIAGNIVITAGYGLVSTDGDTWWIVSAFDLSSGALLWRDVFGDPLNDYFPWQIAVSGGRAFVTGLGGPACRDALFYQFASTFSGFPCDQVTRAYELRTGRVIWTIRHDGNGGVDGTTTVAALADMVYVGGFIGGTQFVPSAPLCANTQPTVRAYDAASGLLVWEDVIEDPLGDGFVVKIVARGRQVVAAIFNNEDWLVRAYDAQSGVVSWSRTYSKLGHPPFGVWDGAVHVAVDEQVVLVGGYGSSTEDFSSRDFTVNAYDAESGRLLWSDVFGSSTGADEANGGVILANDQAFAFGFTRGADDLPHWVVRAYGARTGKLRWQDRVDRESGPTGISIGLAEGGGILAAAGHAFGSRPPGTPFPESEGLDLLVRAYDVGADQGDGNDANR
jgi:hypothetical protein